MIGFEVLMKLELMNFQGRGMVFISNSRVRRNKIDYQYIMFFRTEAVRQ